MTIAQKISEFSLCYKEAAKIWLFYSDLPEELNKIKSNPLLSMRLFAAMAHERAGRNPNFSKFHRIALKRALEKRKNFEDALLNDSKYPDRVWNEFEEQTPTKENGKKAANPTHTMGAVKEILEKMREEKEPNIVTLLGKKQVEKAREFLCSLKGIGFKLSALIMRDFCDFFDLWKYELKLDKEKYFHLQPVDRWIERVSKLVWNIELEGCHDEEAKKITKCCLEENIDPIAFNQGAWFISAKLNELCPFQRIPEDKRELDKITELIEQLDPKKIKEAIHKAFIGLKNGEAILIW